MLDEGESGSEKESEKQKMGGVEDKTRWRLGQECSLYR